MSPLEKKRRGGAWSEEKVVEECEREKNEKGQVEWRVRGLHDARLTLGETTLFLSFFFFSCLLCSARAPCSL